MLPTKKFNDLPLVTNLADSDKIFCIVGGVDSLITVGSLKLIFGTGISTGGGGGGPSGGSRSGIMVSDTYSGLMSYEYGSEYYESPYIYKRTITGIWRIDAITDFDIPTGSSSSTATGFVVGSYAALLLSEKSCEYHELPYYYKKYNDTTGVMQVLTITDFDIPTGVGATTGIMVSTYADLLLSDPGYEYHEAPYVYKKIGTGAVRVDIITDFTYP